MRVIRLIELRSVSIVTVVRVDDIFAAGVKSRCDQLCEYPNRLVPVNNLGELRWYAGCRLSRDWDAGTWTISQRGFAENTAVRFGGSSGNSKPRSTGLKLKRFDENEHVG